MISSGKQIEADGNFELVDFTIDVRLNAVGKACIETIRIMEIAGFLEVSSLESPTVSVAPWHGCEV